jgi:hypothetical protein
MLHVLLLAVAIGFALIFLATLPVSPTIGLGLATVSLLVLLGHKRNILM